MVTAWAVIQGIEAAQTIPKGTGSKNNPEPCSGATDAACSQRFADHLKCLRRQ